MKKFVWFSFVGIFLLQTACNFVMPDIRNTANPEIPEKTLENPKDSVTPLETNWQITVSPTQIISPEITSAISTPNPTNETETPTQIPTPILTKSDNLLKVQNGSPVAISNFAHPELGCNWMGVAGQIIDIDNQPIKDIVVEVGGTLVGKPIFGLAVTGESSEYGPGGFEVKLGDEPIATDGTLWIVVYDLDGNKVMPPFFFSTYSDCERNLIIINFVKIRPLSSNTVYLPVIYNSFLQP